MRILLTGKDGQLGHELVPRLEAIGQLTATRRSDMDLENVAAVRDVLRDVQPELIVNAAAWTAVDLAEEEPDRADAVNHRALAVLAREARDLTSPLIHFSTDYVFDGRKDEPWSEQDLPAPLNVYGRTKLAGEEAIRAAGVPHVILRLSWVYGRRGHNFLNTMLRLLRERPEVAVVNDQFGSPTWCGAIAGATAQVINRIVDAGSTVPAAFALNTGTFHVAGSGRASWFDFANAIRDHLLSRDESVGRLHGIPTAEYRTAAARPRNSLLSSRRLSDQFGVELPAWDAQLKNCLAAG